MSAAQAREAARLTVEQAARQVRICPAYLRRIERHGGATYALAMRLARLYGCSANLFLYPTSEGQSRYPKSQLTDRNRSVANRQAVGKRGGGGKQP